MNAPRQYEVALKWGDETHTSLHTARSRAAARYALFLSVADGFNGLGFRDFLGHVVSVRQTSRRMSYLYVRERYGVEVAVGDRVLSDSEEVVVCQPRSERDSEVWVMGDADRSPVPVHPLSIGASP